MSQVVCQGAQLTCIFGVAPSVLTVLPVNRVLTSKNPAATIMDNKPLVNILPFGMCITPSNPQVAAATAAAFGVLVPQPCIPVITAPWMPGSPTVLIGGQPTLNATSQCMCAWGGVIKPISPGQFTVNVP
jgi:hypothetical protein